MKLSEAMEVIETHERLSSARGGYMVHFERVDGCVLRTDYFPDKNAGEELIATMDKAWELAERFAACTEGECVEIYVVDFMFRPVSDYKLRTIRGR